MLIPPTTYQASSIGNQRNVTASQRVTWLACMQNFFTPTTTSRRRSFSLLRVLGVASLIAGVRGQLFPAQFELSSLQGSNGFVLNGEKSQDQSGYCVSRAGDVNADGMADVLIGAFRADPAADRVDAGKTYVVFGSPKLGTGGTLELSSLNGTNGFVINGVKSDDQSASSVSGAGDVNADGIADLLIGAPQADPGTGRNEAGMTYVVFGRRGLGTGGTLELSDLNGTNGFVLNGARADEQSGHSVSRAGDVNVDGIDDILIGAYSATTGAGRGHAGMTYVVFGKSGLGKSGAIELRGLNGINGFVLNGENNGDQSGYSVSSAGDVNADGIADLLIGARSATPVIGRVNAGKTYVVFGKPSLGAGGVLELSTLNGTNGFVLNGEKSGDESGRPVSSCGDLNADGVHDFLIGAFRAGPAIGREDAGKTYVIFGKPSRAGGVLELSSLDGTNGFVLNGEQFNDRSGRAVSSAGDFNADGVADLIIGAYWAKSGNGRTQAGRTYVVFGNSGLGAGGTLELSSLDGANGFVLNGDQKHEQSGRFVSSAGDINFDGVQDILFGAPLADPTRDRNAAGKTYVVFGRKATTASMESTVTTIASTPSAFATTQGLVSGVSIDDTRVISIPEVTGTRDAPANTSSVGRSYVVLPLGITGGVCALASVVGTALLVFLRKYKPSSSEEIPLEQGETHAEAQEAGVYGPVSAAPLGYGESSYSDME